MADDEADVVRRYWERDVLRLLARLDEERHRLAACHDLLHEIATSSRPLPGGFQERARQLLAEQALADQAEQGQPTG